jgi:hypothetical protein
VKSTVQLSSANELAASSAKSDPVFPNQGQLRFVVVGNPAGHRIALFQAALAELGFPRATEVAWADLLAQRVHLPDIVREGDCVRVESPEKDFEVERTLVAMGAEQNDEEDRGDRPYDRLDRHAFYTQGNGFWDSVLRCDMSRHNSISARRTVE